MLLAPQPSSAQPHPHRRSPPPPPPPLLPSPGALQIALLSLSVPPEPFEHRFHTNYRTCGPEEDTAHGGLDSGICTKEKLDHRDDVKLTPPLITLKAPAWEPCLGCLYFSSLHGTDSDVFVPAIPAFACCPCGHFFHEAERWHNALVYLRDSLKCANGTSRGLQASFSCMACLSSSLTLAILDRHIRTHDLSSVPAFQQRAASTLIAVPPHPRRRGGGGGSTNQIVFTLPLTLLANAC